MNADNASDQRRALLLGLALVCAWGASFTIQKVAYSAMSAGGFLFVRSLAMSSCALALLAWRGAGVWPSLPRPEWRLMLRVTLAGPVLHIALVTYGIHWSTAFSSSLIMALGPVITLVLLRLLRGVRLSRLQLAGVVTALSGVLLLMGEKLAAAQLQASTGDALLLAAAVAFAWYTIEVSPLVQRHGGVAVMCWTTLLATPVLLLASLVPALSTPYGAMPLPVWGAFAWTVLVSAFGGWLAWNWINAVRGVARAAPLLYLVPPMAGVVAWVLGNEHFTPQKLAGAVIALAGVALTQRAPRQAAVQPA